MDLTIPNLTTNQTFPPSLCAARAGYIANLTPQTAYNAMCATFPLTIVLGLSLPEWAWANHYNMVTNSPKSLICRIWKLVFATVLFTSQLACFTTWCVLLLREFYCVPHTASIETLNYNWRLAWGLTGVILGTFMGAGVADMVYFVVEGLVGWLNEGKIGDAIFPFDVIFYIPTFGVLMAPYFGVRWI
jgi:hypothetical protein